MAVTREVQMAIDDMLRESQLAGVDEKLLLVAGTMLAECRRALREANMKLQRIHSIVMEE
jgi:hypothetical protein